MVLLHGHSREAHEQFVQLLVRKFLPQMLDFDPEDHPVLYYGPQQLSDRSGASIADRSSSLLGHLGELICEDYEASIETMSERIAEDRCPAVIDLGFVLDAASEHPEVKVLKA